MRTLAIAAILAAAASANAADAPKSNPQRAEARRHIWTSDVALEQAKIGMQGLYALAADDEGAWDTAHATALLDTVARGVKLAAAQLGHLTNLPAEKGRDA